MLTSSNQIWNNAFNYPPPNKKCYQCKRFVKVLLNKFVCDTYWAFTAHPRFRELCPTLMNCKSYSRSFPKIICEVVNLIWNKFKIHLEQIKQNIKQQTIYVRLPSSHADMPFPRTSHHAMQIWISRLQTASGDKCGNMYPNRSRKIQQIIQNHLKSRHLFLFIPFFLKIDPIREVNTILNIVI